MSAIFEIGRRLKHVKENDLAHGEFGKWLDSMGMNDRVARMMMKVTELGGKRSTYSEMGLNTLYLIATLPPEQREQPHTLADGRLPHVGQIGLREVKRALKEAEARRQQAEQKERLAYGLNTAGWPPFSFSYRRVQS